MDKLKKMIPKNSLLLVLCVLMGCIMIYVLILRINANNIGEEWGNRIGALTGRALGSLQGMTVGRMQGNEAGRQAGLSAEDTEVAISNRLTRVNKLEVLVASVKLTDFHSIGDNIDYASLYLMKGEVIFSVDLSRATVVLEGGELIITVPKPIGELIIDQSRIEKIADYQRIFINGTTEAGYTAMLNSINQIKQKSVEELNEYDVLLEAAEVSAEKQITQLATSSSILANHVTVKFLDEED